MSSCFWTDKIKVFEACGGCFPVGGSAAFSDATWEPSLYGYDVYTQCAETTWDGSKFKSGPAEYVEE